MGGGPPLSPKNMDEQAERDEEEIAEVEMILETYFMSVDNTFNKLQTLCEYIDDTEVSQGCKYAGAAGCMNSEVRPKHGCLSGTGGGFAWRDCGLTFAQTW